ncbi:PAS domain-containing protein [Candidatus Sulfurimonas marisnigri]|uniref:PAS domain-containing protein n=1 Tax=Candidatus Sulfurimonas marisnigri TaxID=2740405 RepID=A0A7S7RQ30_9BACT|nr:PAS domain-containing protein [Candidatus Sulfurimonas marisnigri]QOY55017.1 PAS domain-containing protein [Candidatus Sulfurimonas marisnigri]
MNKVVPIDEEYIFEGRVAISQTDLKGVITFVNRKFSEISGYEVAELIGSNHDIIRHPDVPNSVFIKMWENISSGQVWTGLIKNMRKDGQFYWVDMELAPVLDENDSIIGYISVSKPASRKNIIENEKQYKQENNKK